MHTYPHNHLRQRRSSMYPFVPKSTASLREGDFWAVPMRDGRFACGRVIQVGDLDAPSPTRAFFGGLHDWAGAEPPTAEDLAHRPMLRWGIMHIRAITRTGGSVLGWRSLAVDEIEPPLLLSSMGGDDTQVLRGARPLRAATRDEWGTFPVLGIWGYDFIETLANELLAAARRP